MITAYSADNWLSSHYDAVTDYRMKNTSSIAALLSKTRHELKTMDTLVEGFVDDEAFLTVYFNARRIHDVRGGSKRSREKLKNIIGMLRALIIFWGSILIK